MTHEKRVRGRADEKFACRCQRIDEIELNSIENFNSSSEIRSRLFIVCHLPTTSNNDDTFRLYWDLWSPLLLLLVFPSVLPCCYAIILAVIIHISSHIRWWCLHSFLSKSSLCNFMLWLPCKQCIILFLLQPFIDESSHHSHRLPRVQLNLIINSETCELKNLRVSLSRTTHTHLTLSISDEPLQCISLTAQLLWSLLQLLCELAENYCTQSHDCSARPSFEVMRKFLSFLESSHDSLRSKSRLIAVERRRKKNSIDEMGLKELCEALSNLFQFNDPLWYEKRSGERRW